MATAHGSEHASTSTKCTHSAGALFRTACPVSATRDEMQDLLGMGVTTMVLSPQFMPMVNASINSDVGDDSTAAKFGSGFLLCGWWTSCIVRIAHSNTNGCTGSELLRFSF